MNERDKQGLGSNLRTARLGLATMASMLLLAAVLWAWPGMVPARADDGLLYIDGAAGSDSAVFGPDAPRFRIANGFARAAIAVAGPYDHRLEPAIKPFMEAARPQGVANDCEQLLANPGLDVVNNSIPSWSILEPRVYYSTQDYVSSPSAIVLPDGDEDDPSPTQDAVGQVFTMPPNLTSVTVEFATATVNANATDKAFGNLWTVDAGNNLDKSVGGWQVTDSAGAWANRNVAITDSGDLAAMAGQKMAIVFFTDTDGQDPGEVVYLDDITLTACTGSASTPAATVTTGATPTSSPTPSATPTNQPATGQKGLLPAIFKPAATAQPTVTPAPTVTPGPTTTPGDWRLEIVAGSGNQGGWSSLALDTSGNPHVSFIDITRRRVVYAHRGNAGWQPQDIDGLAVADQLIPLAIAVGSDNHPQIAYNHNAPVINLRYIAWDGANWNGVQFSGVRATWFAMALKQDGEPCISYKETDGDPGANTAKIKLLCRAGGNWPASPEIAVSTLYGISQLETYFHSLAIDSENRRHLSYVKLGSSTYNLYYTRETNTRTWVHQLVDGSGRVGYYSSLALDSAERAHISYYDVTNGDLKYARWDGSQWRVETVDSGGDVGKYTSIGVDGSDRAHISYYDITNKNLKYARWDGSQWRIEIVDSAGEVGEYTSLALNAAGAAYISYYDRSNGDLKVATNSNGRR